MGLLPIRDWCLPVPPLYPPMLLPTVFSLLLPLLLLLLRGCYFLLPLRVVVSDTRCCCATLLLLQGPPFFPSFLPLEPPSPYHPVLRYSSSFRQAPDCSSDLLTHCCLYIDARQKKMSRQEPGGRRVDTCDHGLSSSWKVGVKCEKKYTRHIIRIKIHSIQL